MKTTEKIFSGIAIVPPPTLPPALEISTYSNQPAVFFSHSRMSVVAVASAPVENNFVV